MGLLGRMVVEQGLSEAGLGSMVSVLLVSDFEFKII